MSLVLASKHAHAIGAICVWVFGQKMGQEALKVSGSNPAAMHQHHRPSDFMTDRTLHEAE